MGLLFHISRLSFTLHGSNLKSLDSPSSLNCNCDLVAHSSLSMDPFAHGDTIPMIFSSIHEIYSDISEAHEICYRVMKVLHQIGKNIHAFIHDMTATHEALFVEYFNVIWERVCRDIFSMVDYAIRSDYDCIKRHSMMPLHHQMMTIKGRLHMIFVYSTLMH